MIEVIKVVCLLVWCNFLPPMASVILGKHFDRPLDGGRSWTDGRPILGPHKTVRGVTASLAGTIPISPLLGLSWQVTAAAVLLSIFGDLLSSFIKRRLDYDSGTPVAILDQLFEGLLPILLLNRFMPLIWLQAAAALCIFIPIAHLGSLLWNYLQYRPPARNYSRIIHSTVRRRRWRAAHTPLPRWHWLNFSNFIYYRIVITWCFKAAGLYNKGLRNALQIEVEEVDFHFPALPASFEGFRILLLTDLHLDGLDGLTERVIEHLKEIDEVDLCLVGGDIRMEVYGSMAPSLRHLRRLIPHVKTKNGILGVIGNHDCIEMTPDLEESGITMLINDSWKLERGGEQIWIVGVDDPHYYRQQDMKAAFKEVPDGAFCIFLAHSPEVYAEAGDHDARLYLCGHTHGGQIRLPNRGPLYTCCRAPRSMAAGRWEYKGMTGYTCRGVGASGVPLRFNCPGEICLITLHGASNSAQTPKDRAQITH